MDVISFILTVFVICYLVYKQLLNQLDFDLLMVQG